MDSNLTLSIKNKEESFYPNKLSLDFYEDEARIRTIRITHRYTTLTKFNGVRTAISLEELNSACAYLQLIYDTLPNFSTVEDVLIEDDCVRLLEKFYQCEAILSSLQIPTDFDEDEDDSEIDLYYNWEYYRCSRAILNKKFARPGVKLAICEIMLRQAIKAVERNSTPERNKVVEQIQAIKSGQYVPVEWGLKKLDYSLYTGAITISNEPDLIENISEKI